MQRSLLQQYVYNYIHLVTPVLFCPMSYTIKNEKEQCNSGVTICKQTLCMLMERKILPYKVNGLVRHEYIMRIPIALQFRYSYILCGVENKIGRSHSLGVAINRCSLLSLLGLCCDLLSPGRHVGRRGW